MSARHGLLRYLGLAALAGTLLLGGCALPRMIDSEVQSFPGNPGAVTGVAYRFERLPSQQAYAVGQDRLEALAEPALARVGLVRNDAQARYSVQVDVRLDTFARNPHQPLRDHAGGFGFGVGTSLGDSMFFLSMEPPWYQYTVHLLLRDTTTARIAYETSAVFDGPWSDSDNLLPAILEAALRDYPNPPAGPRKVVVELPPARKER